MVKSGNRLEGHTSWDDMFVEREYIEKLEFDSLCRLLGTAQRPGDTLSLAKVTSLSYRDRSKTHMKSYPRSVEFLPFFGITIQKPFVLGTLKFRFQAIQVVCDLVTVSPELDLTTPSYSKL